MPTFSPRGILTSTFVLCVLAIGIYIIFFFGSDLDPTPAGWGQLGDYVGGVVGTIIGTATVIFLLLTLNAQNKTKNDNFFFYLLQIKETHVASLQGVVAGKPHEGKEFIRALVVQCRLIYHHYSGNPTKVQEFLMTGRPSLIAYLNHNTEIVNFISSTSNDIAKYHSVDYKNIYLAQLSNEEKIILGYFCALVPDAVKVIRQFYVENKINRLIEYERHLTGNRTPQPDAIEEILASL